MPMLSLLFRECVAQPIDGSQNVSRWISLGNPRTVGALFFGSHGVRLALSQVPVESLAKVAPSKAFIYWLEMMAQILMAVIARHVQGHLVRFIDNTAAGTCFAQGILQRMRLSQKPCHVFWAWIAQHNLQLSFHRVTSTANLSDGISRGCWDEAARLGCRRLQPKFNCFYKFFVEVQKGDGANARSKFAKLVDMVAAS